MVNDLVGSGRLADLYMNEMAERCDFIDDDLYCLPWRNTTYIATVS